MEENIFMDKKHIENSLMEIYNEISIKPVQSETQNLFAPEIFTSPLDMVYFLDEVEKRFKCHFCTEDFDYEKFNTIEKISQLILEKS